MLSTITISTRRKTINFLLELDQNKLFKYISNLPYLITHRQLNRKMIQCKVIEYVNVEGVNIEKPFSNGSETTSWWKKFIYYVENNECKIKSHPYWENIATNSPISFELAFDSNEKYVLFEPLPSTEFVDDCDADTVIDEDDVNTSTNVYKPNQDTVFKTANHDQFNRTIPIIQVMKQAPKRSREEEEQEHQNKKYKPITRECRYNSFCTNKDCIFVHPVNIIPGPHNRKCMYGIKCNNRNCKFNHKLI